VQVRGFLAGKFCIFPEPVGGSPDKRSGVGLLPSTGRRSRFAKKRPGELPLRASVWCAKFAQRNWFSCSLGSCRTRCRRRRPRPGSLCCCRSGSRWCP